VYLVPQVYTAFIACGSTAEEGLVWVPGLLYRYHYNQEHMADY